MKRSPLRDLALVVVSGAATPYLLIAVWGSVHTAMRVRSDRIMAFLSPAMHRTRHDLALLAFDALLGLALGALLGALIARVTRSSRWLLWTVFAAAFVASTLVAPGVEGLALRLSVLLRQPMILFVLCGASLGFWLGPRGAESKPGAAH
jgi:hypothetical protein